MNKYETKMVKEVNNFGENLSKFKGIDIYQLPKEMVMTMFHYYALNAQYLVLQKIIKDGHNKKEIMSAFDTVLYKYGKTKALLVKAFFKSDNKDCETAVEKYLYNIKSDEIILYKTLLNQLNNSTIKNNLIFLSENKNEEIVALNNDVPFWENDSTKKLDRCYYINLSSYFNNKGICKEIINSENANLTSGGDSFLGSNWPSDNFFNKNDISFKTKVFLEQYDNISCMNQLIVLERNLYYKIAILGCCEYGTYSENIEVIYDDDSVEIVSLKYLDWIFMPDDENELIWCGKMVIKAEKGYELSQVYNVHLYAKTILVRKKIALKAIRLPDSINMHIFAITMYY
jgi:hypothetical protein